jgi:hypothetical protein
MRRQAAVRGVASTVAAAALLLLAGENQEGTALLLLAGEKIKGRGGERKGTIMHVLVLGEDWLT